MPLYGMGFWRKRLGTEEIMRNRGGHMRLSAAGAAFTLIEMLVVIGIIAILAAMLLPTLNKAKDRAIRVTDINNLKQQTLAMQLYATDNADYLPWPNWGAGDIAPNGLARAGWLYTLNTGAVGPARFKASTGVFWKTLGQLRLYFCPRDYTNAPSFLKREQQTSSYVMNGAVCG